MTDKPPAIVTPLHRNAIVARNARRRIAKQQRLADNPQEAAREQARQERAQRNAEARDKQLALDFAAPAPAPALAPGVVRLHDFAGDRRYWARWIVAKHRQWQAGGGPDDSAA